MPTMSPVNIVSSKQDSNADLRMACSFGENDAFAYINGFMKIQLKVNDNEAKRKVIRTLRMTTTKK